jgi:hypothetical protein
MLDKPTTNPMTAKTLEEMLTYLSEVISWQINSYFKDDYTQPIPFPDISDRDEITLIHFINKNRLNHDEILTLLIALAPHLQPDFFDKHITNNLPESGDYPEIGGWRGENHRGFLPTGQTAIFILGANKLDATLSLQYIFDPEHLFFRERILFLSQTTAGEPLMSSRLVMSADYVTLFSQGIIVQPHFSINFPAQHITTEMNWEDLVLNSETKKQIQEIEAWLKHKNTFLFQWGMKKKFPLGYKALFYGPPGTGKTLTATLLAKKTNLEIFKVDISLVVSKYIGETEKNLANIFAQAENKNWILFFDEADALFSKRTNITDAHDKYANQEVSYLLQ